MKKWYLQSITILQCITQRQRKFSELCKNKEIIFQIFYYRCVCKESGMSYAVKIIDISQNHINADGLDIVEQVHQEINILR